MAPSELSGGLAHSDWAGIRGAYEAERHKAFKTDSGFETRNPGQHWLTEFDGRGFLVKPDGEGWSWGLQLEGYGFEGAMQPVGEAACVSASGGRVAYDWDANVQEWYVNDTRGLEHGYTIQSRPAQGENKGAPLTMELSVRGSLRAEVHADGKGVRFVNSQGGTSLTYAGLHVYDADGITQLSQFAAVGNNLHIQVQDSKAKFPLTIDPIAQQAYLKASNPEIEDWFGFSVACSDELVVVGAFHEDSNATGIDGDQSNNDFEDSGAVYIFERSGGVWSQQAYLKASNTGFLDSFGTSVAVLGETVVVGAPRESSNATGVDGDQSNDSAVGSGAVYVFERSGGVWSQQAYLKASNSNAGDSFGGSVSISGDLLVVGAAGEQSNAIGVDGNQNDNSADLSGAAYVFERSGGVWSQQAYLKASNSASLDLFGSSVASSGDLLVVGALGEDSSATGVNGVQGSNSAPESGAAYIFERSGGVWSQQAYLKASNTDSMDVFGAYVDISGEVVVVGAVLEDSNATGVDGDQSDNSASRSGAAYVYERIGGVWSQRAYLKASNTDTNDGFGEAVAVSGLRVVVAARGESSSAVGVNGDQSDNSLPSGAAYIFEKIGGAWRQQTFLKASNPGQHDSFGQAVAISGDMLVVGAHFESSDATGVDGDQTSNGAPYSGAAYIFDLSAPVANYCGLAALNSTGFPGVITTSGSIVVADNAFTLRAENLPAGVFGYFISSMGQDFVGMPGGSQGNLCLGGGSAIGRHTASMQMSTGAGVIENLLDLTDRPTPTTPIAVLAGDSWNFQCWYRDLNPSSTSNFTDAVSVLFE